MESFIKPVLLLVVAAITPMTWAQNNTFAEGDYCIRTLYGCPGQAGTAGYADVCKQSVVTSKLLYHLALSNNKDEKWRLVPIQGKPDQYYIGSNCEGQECQRHWTYTRLNSQIRTSATDMTAFRIEKSQTADGYKLVVIDNCYQESPPRGKYPCGYEMSFTTRFFTKWMKVTSANDKVNFEIDKNC